MEEWMGEMSDRSWELKGKRKFGGVRFQKNKTLGGATQEEGTIDLERITQY
jgi:hypothetical protein